MDVVILCGGEGTRIRHLLPEGMPKIMADIDGTPFVEILHRHLEDAGFRRFIYAVGYGRDRISLTAYQLRKLGTMREMGHIVFMTDQVPLGTAGAIRNAIVCVESDPFFIFNGDTYCDVDCRAMLKYHEATQSKITVACDRDLRHIGTFVASRRFVDLIPKVDGKVDMAEVLTLLGQKHEPVGWFMTDAPFYDIGDEAGLLRFRDYWTRFPKGGEGDNERILG